MTFQKEVIKKDQKGQCRPITSAADVLQQTLWGNQNIMIRNQWSECNLLYVKDIINQTGSFVSEYCLQNLLKCKNNWILQYLQLKNATKNILSKFEKDMYCNTSIKHDYIVYTDKVNIIYKQKARFFYNIVKSLKTTVPISQYKWVTYFDKPIWW